MVRSYGLSHAHSDNHVEGKQRKHDREKCQRLERRRVEGTNKENNTPRVHSLDQRQEAGVVPVPEVSTEEEQKDAIAEKKKRKHDETVDVLNKLIKLSEGTNSSLKQTKAANGKKKTADEDEIVAAATEIRKASLLMEDTSTNMGRVEKTLAKLRDDTMENNELVEEAFFMQKATTKPMEHTKNMEDATKKIEDAMQEQLRIAHETAKQRIELWAPGGECDKAEGSGKNRCTLRMALFRAGPRLPQRRWAECGIVATMKEATSMRQLQRSTECVCQRGGTR